jgi:hypothetical protein
MINGATAEAVSSKKCLTVSPNGYQVKFRKIEQWKMVKLMNESIDIQSFLDLLGGCTDAIIDGYKVLLGWAKKVIVSMETQKDRGDPLEDKAREFVHDFLIHKVPSISEHIDTGKYDKYQIAAYVRVSLVKYYRTYIKRLSGTVGKVRSPKKNPISDNDNASFFPKNHNNYINEDDGLHDASDEERDREDNETDGEFSKESRENPDHNPDIYEVMSGRNIHQMYQLMCELSLREKKYLLYHYLNKDKALYKAKTPEAMRKEHSFARKAIEHFISINELESYEMTRFFNSILGRSYINRIKSEIGDQNE